MLHWKISGSIWNEGPIDSHALIWYVDQDKLLSLTSHAAISDPANDLLLSAGSIWEIGIKIGLGKLLLTQPFKRWMNQAISDLDVTVLPLSVEYVDVQSNSQTSVRSFNRGPGNRRTSLTRQRRR
jgi:PIN domain nuclease of toxin-antitoxin system